jgi:hypothetical protein
MGYLAAIFILFFLRRNFGHGTNAGAFILDIILVLFVGTLLQGGC